MIRGVFYSFYYKADNWRYDPACRTSKERYGWIFKYLANAVEETIRIRANH